MKFIGRIYRILAWPFIWIRGLVPEAPEAPQGLVPRVSHNIGFTRTLFAPFWRRFSRGTIVFLGFAIYIGLQLGLAYMIDQLWWWYIVGIFIIAVSFALAAGKPTIAFIVWLVTSPLGFIFLRLDFGAGIPVISYDRVAIGAMVILLVGRMLLNRIRPRKLLFGEWMIIAFIAYIVLTLPFNHFKDMLGLLSDRFMDSMAIGFVLYFLAKASITKKEHVNWILTAIVYVGIYVALFGCYEHYTGNMWFSSFIPVETRLRWTDIEQGRATGPLLNPTPYGTFLGIAVFAAIHLFINMKQTAKKILYAMAAILMAIGCYFSFTRGGYLALGLLVFMMPFFSRNGRKQYSILLALVVVGGIIYVPKILEDAAINRRMTNIGNIEGRLVVTASTLNIIKHNFWFGVGLGNIDNALSQYITNAGQLSGLMARLYTPNQPKLAPIITSHNSILTIFAENGFIGIVLYIGMIVAFIIHMLKARSRLPDGGVLNKGFASFVIIAIIGHILSTLTYDIRFFKFPTYVFWILIALVIRLDELIKQEAYISQPVSLSVCKSRGELTHA